jgi:hypothetical protein
MNTPFRPLPMRSGILVAGLWLALVCQACSTLGGTTEMHSAIERPGYLVCSGGYASRIEAPASSVSRELCQHMTLSEIN